MVLDREIPWRQHSHRADDIATAMRIADEFGYQLVIDHGTEAHLIADLIAEKGIPVLIGPLIVSRTKVEVRNRSTVNPGLLAKAGVEISIITDHPVCPIGYLVLQATLAVKDGLDRDTALRAITINPARVLGLDDRIGSLEVGKLGDLVLWSGDPLDVMQRAQQVFIEGEQVYAWSPTGRARRRRRPAARAAAPPRAAPAARRPAGRAAPSTITSARRSAAPSISARPSSVALTSTIRSLSGCASRVARPASSRASTSRVMVGLVTPSIRASRPSGTGPPKTSTDSALSRAGVSPASASTLPIARSRWMAPELRSRAVDPVARACPSPPENVSIPID